MQRGRRAETWMQRRENNALTYSMSITGQFAQEANETDGWAQVERERVHSSDKAEVRGQEPLIKFSLVV